MSLYPAVLKQNHNVLMFCDKSSRDPCWTFLEFQLRLVIWLHAFSNFSSWLSASVAIVIQSLSSSLDTFNLLTGLKVVDGIRLMIRGCCLVSIIMGLETGRIFD